MTTTMLSGAFKTSELPKLAAEPVTVTVSRAVVPGREAEFENWAAHMAGRLEAFPGSLGAGVLRPGVEGGDYHLIFRFTDAMSLRMWERSPQRAVLLAELDGVVAETRVQRTVGVQQWFDLPDRAEPSRALWKHVFGDVAWVFPVALASSIVVAPYLTKLPIELRTLASAGLITLVMRTAVGPVRKRVRDRRSFG